MSISNRDGILVIGAGRSTYHLHKYLSAYAEKHDFTLTVADIDIRAAESMCFGQNSVAVQLDISQEEQLHKLLRSQKVVVSMLPAHLHFEVIRVCIDIGIHVATASYLNEDVKNLHDLAKGKGITVLNELGLDPGIDHLSAVKMIHSIQEQGLKVTHFESFTGGLVAPQYDTNPWKYKFTWNPRNVVVAGQGGIVKFIQEGQYKFIPYHKLFRRTEVIQIEGYGKFEGYANRDSLKYRETYGLNDVLTMYRGTLRRPGFCKAWDCLVQLGMTDDSYELPRVDQMTHRDFTNSFLAYNPNDSVELKLRQYLKIDQDESDLWERIESIGLFNSEKIGLTRGTPAQILQHILQKKWALEDGDKDMIVMWHKLKYSDEAGQSREIHASLVVIGDDERATAMSKTVGYPLAIGTILLFEDKILERGCILPVSKEIYNPILTELERYGIRFSETEVDY